MHTRIAPVSSKGQVTIPAEIRRRLGVGGTDKVVFVVRDDGVVELRAPSFTLEDVFGSIDPLPQESADLDQEIEAAIAAGLAEDQDPT
jgi:AbrB family looped-hinge helix DNA binding protein